MPTLDLRALLELRTANPADIEGDTLLARCDLPGTMQLFRMPLQAGGALEQLTDFRDPVEGRFVSGTGRILLEHDVAGNELQQLSLLDAHPSAKPEALVRAQRFAHRDPKLSHDGTLLAYATNRDNGVDWAVYVRSLREQAERCVIAPEGTNAPAGFSPDGKVLAVTRDGDRSGDVELYLVDLQTAGVDHITPHAEAAFYGEPVWRPDGSAFFAATDEGRQLRAVARYDLAT